MHTQLLLKISQVGYFTLILLLGVGALALYSSQLYSGIFIILGLIPIFIPIKGVLRGSPYTYAWSCFLLCLYLLHGLTFIYTSETLLEFSFALIETVLAASLIASFSFYARFKAQELKLGK